MIRIENIREVSSTEKVLQELIDELSETKGCVTARSIVAKKKTALALREEVHG